MRLCNKFNMGYLVALKVFMVWFCSEVCIAGYRGNLVYGTKKFCLLYDILLFSSQLQNKANYVIGTEENSLLYHFFIRSLYIEFPLYLHSIMSLSWKVKTGYMKFKLKV